MREITMSASNENMRRQVWAAYWSTGQLHSCAASFVGNYGGAIGSFWRGHFLSMPVGCRVLDLATGNGPLPLLLWETRRETVEIDAIDLAPLAPAWYGSAHRGSVRFHSGISMEALPFPDGSFDHVISQFGFEYGNRTRALAECLRVARSQATLALVLHHAESVLVRVGREELGHHERLGAKGGLLETARDVIPWVARAKAGVSLGEAALQARVRYNHAMKELAEIAAVSSVPDLLFEAREFVHRLLASVGADPQPTLDALDVYVDSLDGARLRAAEMVEHALDRSQLDEMASQLRAARPDVMVECVELRQSEGLLAWSFVARLAAASGG